MGEILNPHKLEVFDPEEDYNVEKYNENTRKINAAIPVVSRAVSTVNGNDIDFRASTFTKTKVGNLAIVVADIKATIKATRSLVIPGNTSAALNIPGIVPLGFQPLSTLNMQSGPVFSGEGRGDNLQGGFAGNANRDILLRSTGAGFTRASNGDVNLAWNVVYASVL